jgi:hypothetical protein
MADIWVYGDTAGPITATLQTDGAVQSLVGASVAAQRRNVRTGAVTPVPVTVLDALMGVVVITQAERATWPSGSYALRFSVTYSDSTVDIFPSAGPEPVVTVRAAW